MDYPDSALADRRWDGAARGSSFASDPYGTLGELYEPQAPTRARPSSPPGGAPSSGRGGAPEGLMGAESYMLQVVDRSETFRDPYTLREEIRLDTFP